MVSLVSPWRESCARGWGAARVSLVRLAVPCLLIEPKDKLCAMARTPHHRKIFFTVRTYLISVSTSPRAVLEKEKRTAEHGSGRNSGVLHAGFYYTANSLRARLCRDGNAQLTEFCEEHSVPLNKCGKLVVCKDETELSGLDELLRRARANGVELHKITAHEAREIEVRQTEFAVKVPNGIAN